MLYSGTVFVDSLVPYYSNHHLFLLFLPLEPDFFLSDFMNPFFFWNVAKHQASLMIWSLY